MENTDKKPLVLDHAAILVVDMLQDFVYGALTCERGVAIVPATARLLDAAREAGLPVIFCNDAHLPKIDRELELWGDHVIVGTDGTYSFAIESANVSVKANILQDGTMALEFAAGDTATTLYFEKAE